MVRKVKTNSIWTTFNPSEIKYVRNCKNCGNRLESRHAGQLLCARCSTRVRQRKAREKSKLK